MGAGGESYGGAIGRTRLEAVHLSCGCGRTYVSEIVRSIDAAHDPELVAQLTSGSLNRPMCPSCGRTGRVDAPIVVHDPERRTFVLVVPQGLVHRELDERAALLGALARDTGHAIPAYVRDFRVVHGGEGLTDTEERERGVDERERGLDERERGLDERERALADHERSLADHAAELERHQSDLAADVSALAEQRSALAAEKTELSRRTSELEDRARQLDARAEELSRRAAELASQERADRITPTPRVEPRAMGSRKNEEVATGPFTRLDEVVVSEIDPEESLRTMIGGMTDAAPPARSSRQHDSNATRVSPPPLRDVAVERWILSRQPTWKLLEEGTARLLASLPAERLEGLVQGSLDARVQLHRLPTYPVVAITVGGGDADGEPLFFTFDVQRLDDRAILGALAQRFRLVLDLYDPDHIAVVQRTVEAPLDANVRHVLAQAEAHLAAVHPSARSFEAAASAVRAPSYDRFGRRPHNLDEDSFSLLPTPGTARLALGIVSYWSEPENEDYLILVRSFPIDWWRRIRGRVVARAIDFGLALPEPLVELAIAEGHGRTRKDVVARLCSNFADVVTGLKPNDLDPDQVRENWRGLMIACDHAGISLEGRAADLAALAVGAPAPAPVDTGARIRAPQAPRTVRDRSPGPIIAGEIRPRASSQAPGSSLHAAPSSITSGPTLPSRPPRDVRQASIDDLLHLLDDKDLRREVAQELCRRGDASSVGPVFGAVRRMTRGEAVRVLPAVVHFGERAVPHLIDGLRSRKAYLRQGCALALGILKSAEGIEALCELLVGEPTDVWREVARAIGEVGGGAIMSLASRVREPSREAVPPETRERIAWALAHIAAHGSGYEASVENLATGRDPVVAGVAKRAIELANTARLNDDEVKSESPPRDQTVNRAFSRRFFEAMGGGAALRSLAVETGEAELLDESDILDEDEELLDDEDLIPG
jgi:hypothetical protein